MGILVFPQTVNLLCGHGEVTIIVACRSVKCGICGFVTPLAAQPVNALDASPVERCEHGNLRGRCYVEICSFSKYGERQ